MRKLRTVLALAAASFLVASCASSSAPPTDGCTKTSSQEWFQNGMYECRNGTVIYTFATTAARDNWIGVATQFGAEVLDKGATWVKVKKAG